MALWFERIDFDTFLAKILFRRSTLSEADLRAAFADCNDLLTELVLDGKKVGLPWGYVGASIKGSLDGWALTTSDSVEARVVLRARTTRPST